MSFSYWHVSDIRNVSGCWCCCIPKQKACNTAKYFSCAGISNGVMLGWVSISDFRISTLLVDLIYTMFWGLGYAYLIPVFNLWWNVNFKSMPKLFFEGNRSYRMDGFVSFHSVGRFYLGVWFHMWQAFMVFDCVVGLPILFLREWGIYLIEYGSYLRFWFMYIRKEIKNDITLLIIFYLIEYGSYLDFDLCILEGKLKMISLC